MVSVVCLMVSVVAGNVVLWLPSLVCYGFRRGRERFLMVSVAGLLMDSAVAGGSIILDYIE